MMRLRRCIIQEAEDKPFFALTTDEKPEDIERLPSNKYKIIGMCVGVVGVWV
jgi:hypothetical protein